MAKAKEVMEALETEKEEAGDDVSTYVSTSFSPVRHFHVVSFLMISKIPKFSVDRVSLGLHHPPGRETSTEEEADSQSQRSSQEDKSG